MNRLFSKNKKRKLYILGACIFFYTFTSFVQNTNKDPFTTLCKDSDAYYTHSYKDITFAKSWSGYKKYISINKKLVVNTTKGVEEHAFIKLSEFKANRIKSFKVRTLKADGSIVELDSSVVFKRKPKKYRINAVDYPIPAVEPGDTIETSYEYYENLNSSDLIGYVNLYSPLPSFNSQYTIKTSSELSVYYKTYNGFPEPEVVANDTIVYLQFSADNIKGLEINEYNCLPCEKPYFYYSLEKRDSKLRTWKDVYNEEFNFLTQPMALDGEKSSYYKRWKRRVIGTAKDSSKFYKLNLLYNEVLKKFTMDFPQEREIIKSTGYFLKKERFDPISIRRFYRHILEDLEIDYWAVFAKDKEGGPIDIDYIRRGEFDHMFFAFKNEKGRVKFLFPHEPFYMYQMDEIPTSLYDTGAILVKHFENKRKRRRDKFINRKLQLATTDSVSVATIVLPGMDYNNNYIQQTVFSKVDIDSKETSFKYRFKVSGGLSTELRSFLEMLDNDKDMSEFYDRVSEVEGDDSAMQIDTVMSRVQQARKPFSYVMSAQGTLKDVVTFINDSLVSISIDKLIRHNQIENASKTADLSYYLSYNFSDYYMFYLQFPCDIKVLGLENGSVDFKNEFGEYLFKLEQSNTNELKLLSNYKILKSTIPKEKLEALTALNDQVKNLKKKRLIVKLKRTP